MGHSFTNDIARSLRPLSCVSHQRHTMAVLTLLRRVLGVTGHLPSKHALSPSLQRASRDFLAGPPPSAGGQWITHCCFYELSTVLGKAWAGTTHIKGEAAKEWMTSHVDYPDARTKEQLSIYYMGSSIAQAMRRGAVVLAGQRKGDVTAVLIVSEKTHNQPTPTHYTGHWWWELGVTLRLADMVLPALLQCQIYQGQQGQSQRKASALSDLKQGYHDQNRPRTQYWSVEMVGIDPRQQGLGYGRELVDRLCALADEAGVACYLEAAGPKNALFYEGSGFTSIRSLSVDDPTDPKGLPLQVEIMRRLPQPHF